jgi:hypothetical protein
MQAESVMSAPRTGVMAVMGREGDTKYAWDKTSPADVAIARRTFNKFRQEGYLAFRVKDGGGESKGELMTEFDPDAEKIVFCPQMRGG